MEEAWFREKLRFFNILVVQGAVARNYIDISCCLVT